MIVAPSINVQTYLRAYARTNYIFFAPNNMQILWPTQLGVLTGGGKGGIVTTWEDNRKEGNWGKGVSQGGNKLNVKGVENVPHFYFNFWIHLQNCINDH